MKIKFIYITVIFSVPLLLFCVSACTLSKRLGGGYPFAKEHSVKSKYYGEFLQVYCEDNFSFQKGGVITGSFTLSKYVDYDALRVHILVPALFRDTPWAGTFSIPGTLKLIWDEGSLEGIVTQENSFWAFLDFSPYKFEQNLPVNHTIKYIFTYNAGAYTKKPDFFGTGLLYYDNERKIFVDKTEDIKMYPENYSELWQAKFMVVEARRKGETK